MIVSSIRLSLLSATETPNARNISLMMRDVVSNRKKYKANLNMSKFRNEKKRE